MTKLAKISLNKLIDEAENTYAKLVDNPQSFGYSNLGEYKIWLSKALAFLYEHRIEAPVEVFGPHLNKSIDTAIQYNPTDSSSYNSFPNNTLTKEKFISILISQLIFLRKIKGIRISSLEKVTIYISEKKLLLSDEPAFQKKSTIGAEMLRIIKYLNDSSEPVKSRIIARDKSEEKSPRDIQSAVLKINQKVESLGYEMPPNDQNRKFIQADLKYGYQLNRNLFDIKFVE